MTIGMTFRGAALYVAIALTACGEGEPRPVLPVHVWCERQHLIGLLSIQTGELHFTTFLRKAASEPSHPGYWIESWKIDGLRKILPATLRQFRFVSPIVVGGVTYLRILPAQSIPAGDHL